MVNKYNNDEAMLQVTEKNGMIIYTKVEAASAKDRRDRYKRSQTHTVNNFMEGDRTGSFDDLLDDDHQAEMHVDGAAHSEQDEQISQASPKPVQADDLQPQSCSPSPAKHSDPENPFEIVLKKEQINEMVTYSWDQHTFTPSIPTLNGIRTSLPKSVGKFDPALGAMPLLNNGVLALGFDDKSVSTKSHLEGAFL